MASVYAKSFSDRASKVEPVNAQNEPSPNNKPIQPTLRKVPKDSMPRNYRKLWIVVGIAGIAMLSATAGAILAMTMASTPLMQRKFTAEEAAVFSNGDLSTVNNLQLPELTRPVNILVLGAKVLTSDVSDDTASQQKLGYQALLNSFEGLTDTMLLLRFNPQTKKIALLWIPRDTRIDIPGHGIGKINEANSNGGPALSAKTVSQLLGGVGVDRYITINVQGVEALVNALGGVTVYVPKDMKYRDDSQHLYVNLKAGKQHLNGDQILQLLRFRHDEMGDIGRVQRQQMVIRAMSEQALTPATLARLPQILSVIKSHIDTNLTVEELVALTGFASRIDRSNMQMLYVPGEYGDIETYGTSYWLPDAKRIQALTARYFDLGSPDGTADPAAKLRVTIQDSTRQASSQILINQLTQAGYANVATAEPYGEPLTVTRIVAQQGDRENAEAIRKTLGFGEVRVEGTGDLNSDVTIQLGQDWLQKQSQHGGATSSFNSPSANKVK